MKIKIALIALAGLSAFEARASQVGPWISTGIVFAAINTGPNANPAFLRHVKSFSVTGSYASGDPSGVLDYGNGKYGFGATYAMGDSGGYGAGVGVGKEQLSFGVAYINGEIDLGIENGQMQGRQWAFTFTNAAKPTTGNFSAGVGFIEAKHYHMEANLRLPSYTEFTGDNAQFMASIGAAVYAKGFGAGFLAIAAYNMSTSTFTIANQGTLLWQPMNAVNLYVGYGNGSIAASSSSTTSIGTTTTGSTTTVGSLFTFGAGVEF